MRLSNFKIKYRNLRCSNRKTKKNIKKVFPDSVQFNAACQKQSFSLPDSVMHYVSENPQTCEFYEKLIQTCKFFFHKNPILVIPRLFYTNKGWKTKKRSTKFISKGKMINLKHISSKLWITDAININPKTVNDKFIVSSITPKIYECQVERLILKYQFIFFEELEIFASFAQIINLKDSVVKYKNGTFVEVEKIFELFPDILEIYFPSTPKITFKTVTELLKNPQFFKLTDFDLCDIPEDFDIERFFIYLKKNKLKRIDLKFSDTISDAYIDRLFDIVNEMFETENRVYKLPQMDLSSEANVENVLKMIDYNILVSEERFADYFL